MQNEECKMQTQAFTGILHFTFCLLPSPRQAEGAPGSLDLKTGVETTKDTKDTK
jgi:hypothetical protein